MAKATAPRAKPRKAGFKYTRGGTLILGRSPVSGNNVLASAVVSPERVMRDLEILRAAREAERTSPGAREE